MSPKDAFDPRKHEWRGGGWRHHVVSYGGRRDPWTGQIIGFRKCSEPECEVNREATDGLTR